MAYFGDFSYHGDIYRPNNIQLICLLHFSKKFQSHFLQIIGNKFFIHPEKDPLRRFFIPRLCFSTCQRSNDLFIASPGNFRKKRSFSAENRNFFISTLKMAHFGEFSYHDAIYRPKNVQRIFLLHFSEHFQGRNAHFPPKIGNIFLFRPPK